MLQTVRFSGMSLFNLDKSSQKPMHPCPELLQVCVGPSRGGCAAQVVWNSKMREEVLARMKAAREDPEAGATPTDFRFQALQAIIPPISSFGLLVETVHNQ